MTRVEEASQALSEQLSRRAHCENALRCAREDLRWAREAVKRAREVLRRAKREAR